ncbi:MAG: metallophosphoesterase family protein, partial [Thermodesulfobacteriota bacterium]
MKYYLTVFLIILPVILFQLPGLEAVEKDITLSKKEIFRIWALADIQPKNTGQKASFTQAINDINNNVPNVKFSIVAGDIVHKTESETFDWYLNERSKSYITDWYEIIGNHDLKSDRGKLFKEKLREETHYSKQYGNLLFIFLSDE